jgi:hypothetical protein
MMFRVLELNTLIFIGTDYKKEHPRIRVSVAREFPQNVDLLTAAFWPLAFL